MACIAFAAFRVNIVFDTTVALIWVSTVAGAITFAASRVYDMFGATAVLTWVGAATDTLATAASRTDVLPDVTYRVAFVAS
jgi:hypothetical protein